MITETVTILNYLYEITQANSNTIIDWFTEGLNETIRSKTRVFNLKIDKHYHQIIQSIKDTDAVLMVFPLYTDAMPGIVKKFIEYLGENRSVVKGKKFIYVVHFQLGLTVNAHARGIEKDYYKRVQGLLLQIMHFINSPEVKDSV